MKRSMLHCAAAASVAALLAFAAASPPAVGATPPDKSGQCIVCHGADGISKLPNAPHIAGQPEVYLVKSLEAYRSGERKDEMMSLVAKPLTDADIAALAQWYSSIEITATLPK